MRILGVLWGVAATVFREAIRSKFFLVVAGFALISIVFIGIVPAGGLEEKSKFVVIWSLELGTWMAAFSLLFLAVPAISREIEEKKLQQVLVKPVGRLVYLIGRILGYGAITLILFLAMGLISYGTIQSGWVGDFSEAAFFKTSRMIEAETAVVVGSTAPSKDWRVGEWLSPGGEVNYHFGDLSGENFDREKTTIFVHMLGSVVAEYVSFCAGKIILRNNTNGMVLERPVYIGRDAIGVPFLESDPLPNEMLQGEIKIQLQPTFGWLGVGSRAHPEQDGIRIQVQGSGSFFQNLMTSYFLRAIAVFLLLSLSVSLSALVSGKIALFLSIALMFGGFFPQYVHLVGPLLRGNADLEAHDHSDDEPHDHEAEKGSEGLHEEERETVKKPSPLLQGISILFDGLGFALPDLDRFDSGGSLVAGYSIGKQRLRDLFLYLGKYLAASCLFGAVILKYRSYS